MSKVDLDKTTDAQLNSAEEESAKCKFVTKKRVRYLTFIVTISLAGFVCYLSMERYFSWMVQTVIDRTDVHISEIPFPAVTLCPLMTVHSALMGVHQRDKPLIQKFLLQLDDYIDDDVSSEFNSQARMALELVYGQEVLNTVSYRCEDFFAECTWRRIKWDCCRLFRPKKYGMSLCYSFNSLAVDDPDPSWPWSETLSGRNSGLSVTMRTNASKSMIPKVMAMIHYPEEPYSSDTSYLEGVVQVSLDASKFHADAELKRLSPEDEMEKYMHSNYVCLKDCRMAYMEKVCNCVPRNPFYRRIPSKQTDSCNVTHLECIYEHRDAFYSTGNIYERNLSEETTEVMDCKCYPNCNYVQYKPFMQYISELSNISRDKDQVDLSISFLRDTIFSYRSAMVYNLLDLLVAICSIIALFLGVSFISVVKAIQDHFERRRIARTQGKAKPNQ